MEIKVNGIKIHYEVMGKGKPIILLNPNGVNTKLMTFLADKLKDNYEVYLFDRRCTGKSEKDCALTYEASASDVHEFIEQLKLDKPYILGCSGGGTLALYVAIFYPENVSKLILCSGLARNNIVKKPIYAKIMERLPWYPGKKDNEKFEKLLTNSRSLEERELNKITIPTLVVNGGKKDIVPKTEAEYISNNIKNSELFILEKSGHCNYVINNEDFYNKLFEFLER